MNVGCFYNIHYQNRNYDISFQKLSLNFISYFLFHFNEGFLTLRHNILFIIISFCPVSYYLILFNKNFAIKMHNRILVICLFNVGTLWLILLLDKIFLPFIHPMKGFKMEMEKNIAMSIDLRCCILRFNIVGLNEGICFLDMNIEHQAEQSDLFLTFSRLFNGMKKSYLTIYSMAYALLWHKLGNSFPLGVKL